MTKLSKTGFGFIRAGVVVLLALMGLLRPALAVDTNAAPEAAPSSSAQEFLRAFQQIQEQFRNTLLALEKNRQEAQAAAASNALALEQRLQLMEKTLANERLEELRSIEGSNRMVLMAAGVLGALGVLGLLLAVFLQWSAVHRLAAAAASPPQVLGLGESQLLPAHALEESNARFLGVMERLEQRILELEASVRTPQSLPEHGAANGESNGCAMELSHEEIPRSAEPDKSGVIALLVGKSQTLLKLDKPEAALGCLEEVLTLDPAHADALIKKGAALERLQRFDEAVQCYDRAIAQDNSLTMAYLCKGGVFNRVGRYSEALACYEQALNRGSQTAK